MSCAWARATLPALVVLASAFAQQNIITTFAGSDYVFPGDGGRATAAPLGRIYGIVTDRQGFIYFTDPLNNLVMRIAPNGTLNVIAGDGKFDSEGAQNVPATQASLTGPSGIAVENSGAFYFVEAHGNVIRRVSPDGIITTVATGFNDATGLALDANGNLYVADTGAHRILRIAPDGTQTVFAGTGSPGFSGDGGSAASAQLNFPSASPSIATATC